MAKKFVAPQAKGKNAKVSAKQAQLVAAMMKGKKSAPEVESAAEDKMPDEEAE